VTFDELVTVVLEEGGFDVSRARAGGWVNEVHKRAVAESQWQMVSLSLGQTVADQATYDVPANAVDIVSLHLSGEGEPADWRRVSTMDMWALRAGRKHLAGSGGVFAPSFTAAGQAQIELFPGPVVEGLEITALAAISPVSMTPGMAPVVPDDLHGDLADGAIALGLLRMDERPDSAAAFEARLQRMVAKLARRKNSRIGSGTSRLKAFGYDWR
jgi:hypothetical protein